MLLVLVEDAREEMDVVQRMALGSGVGREVVSNAVTVAWLRMGAARVDGFRSSVVQIRGMPAWDKALAEVGITSGNVSGVKGGASKQGIGDGGSTSSVATARAVESQLSGRCALNKLGKIMKILVELE